MKFFGSNFHLCFYSICHNFFEFLSCGKPFSDPHIYFIKVKIFTRMKNSVTKMTCFRHVGISKKNCCEWMSMHLWNFKPKILSIFHFWLINDGWISGILYLNRKSIYICYKFDFFVDAMISTIWMIWTLIWTDRVLKDRLYKRILSNYRTIQ